MTSDDVWDKMFNDFWTPEDAPYRENLRQRAKRTIAVNAVGDNSTGISLEDVLGKKASPNARVVAQYHMQLFNIASDNDPNNGVYGDVTPVEEEFIEQIIVEMLGADKKIYNRVQRYLENEHSDMTARHINRKEGFMYDATRQFAAFLKKTGNTEKEDIERALETFGPHYGLFTPVVGRSQNGKPDSRVTVNLVSYLMVLVPSITNPDMEKKPIQMPAPTDANPLWTNILLEKLSAAEDTINEMEGDAAAKARASVKMQNEVAYFIENITEGNVDPGHIRRAIYMAHDNLRKERNQTYFACKEILKGEPPEVMPQGLQTIYEARPLFNTALQIGSQEELALTQYAMAVAGMRDKNAVEVLFQERGEMTNPFRVAMEKDYSTQLKHDFQTHIALNPVEVVAGYWAMRHDQPYKPVIKVNGKGGLK